MGVLGVRRLAGPRGAPPCPPDVLESWLAALGGSPGNASRGDPAPGAAFAGSRRAPRPRTFIRERLLRHRVALLQRAVELVPRSVRQPGRVDAVRSLDWLCQR